MSLRRASLGLVLLLVLRTAQAVDPWSNPEPVEEQDGLVSYFDLNAFAGNTVVPLHNILHPGTWAAVYGPRAGNNLGVASARASAGASLDGFRIGAVYRQDWFASANRSALDLFEQSQNGFTLPGSPQRAFFHLRGWSGDGIILAKDTTWALGASPWRLTADVGINLLEGRRIHQEDWNGDFSPLEPGIVLASGTVTRDIDNMHHNLFGGPITRGPHPHGEGWSGDFALRIANTEGWRLDVSVADAISVMHWNGVPSELFVANGYVACLQLTGACAGAKLNYPDLASGAVVRSDLSQRLDSKETVAATIPWRGFEFSARDALAYGIHLPGLAARYVGEGRWHAGLDYDTRFRALGVEGGYRWISLACQTDSLDVPRARVMALSLKLRAQW